MKDKVVDSFLLIDYSEIKLPIICIYENPKDYPQKFVARLFDLNTPTNCIVIGNSLEHVRKTIPSNMMRVERDLKDEKILIESWL